jgi:CRISPR system Cascade subunit CasE
MTEFTRIVIDPRHRHTAWILASLERLHAVVSRSLDPESAWNGDGGNVPHASHASHALWRLDTGGVGRPCRLYIVSETTPNEQVLYEQFGIGPKNISTCAYEPFLSHLECGQEWGFRLKANPTRSARSDDRSRGQCRGLTRVDDQIEWLYRKARMSGFHMPINRLENPEVVIHESRQISFNRHGMPVTLSSVVYDGVLAVDDPELLRQALTTGIGRAKGYGFGLLTLVPLANKSR